MDGAGGETGGETEQKGGKGARCCKQVGRGGREGVEHESRKQVGLGSTGCWYKAKREVARPRWAPLVR